MKKTKTKKRKKQKKSLFVCFGFRFFHCFFFFKGGEGRGGEASGLTPPHLRVHLSILNSTPGIVGGAMDGLWSYVRLHDMRLMSTHSNPTSTQLHPNPPPRGCLWPATFPIATRCFRVRHDLDGPGVVGPAAFLPAHLLHRDAFPWAVPS